MLLNRRVRKLSSLSCVYNSVIGETLEISTPLDAVFDRLLHDLKILGLPVDEVSLELRPYSKTYYGNYFPTEDPELKPRVWIYPYRSAEGMYLSYSKICESGIHEMCHHIQYKDPSYKRKRGVMHDTDFWNLYNFYITKAKNLGILKQEEEDET